MTGRPHPLAPSLSRHVPVTSLDEDLGSGKRRWAFPKGRLVQAQLMRWCGVSFLLMGGAPALLAQGVKSGGHGSLAAHVSPSPSLGGSGALSAEKSAEHWIEKGNVYDVKLEAAAALQAYQEAEKLEPKNAVTMVRIARQYRHLMADASSKEERLRLGNLALQYGRRAAAFGPRNSDAQLSTAISYGKMLPLMSGKNQLESSRAIKVSVDKALALDRDNDLAWHILGRWHRGLAEVSSVKRTLASMVYDEELPQCTHEDSVKCFETAIRINPKRLMHYIELGTTYHAMEREEEAKKCLNQGLAMPLVEKDDAELKQRGREVLAKIK